MRILLLAVTCQLALCIPAFAGESDTKTPVTQAHPTDMLVSTTDSLSGFKIKEYKGVVRGITVRQPTIGQGLVANFERIKGGHMGAYVAMCELARQQAYDMCLDKARELGANAVIGMGYDSSAFEHGDNIDTEVICYGTAVTVEQEPGR